MENKKRIINKYKLLIYFRHMKWKVISSKYLANDPPWYTTRVETVELPNGEVLENYYILEYPNWVSVIAITEDNQIVMVEQYRHAIGEIGIELPAGVIDDEDQDPLFAAKRELLEETGFGGGEWAYFMKTSANPGTHTNFNFIYIARNVKLLQDQQLDRTEDLKVHLFTMEELREMLKKDEIIQAMHAAALWKLIANTD